MKGEFISFPLSPLKIHFLWRSREALTLSPAYDNRLLTLEERKGPLTLSSNSTWDESRCCCSALSFSTADRLCSGMILYKTTSDEDTRLCNTICCWLTMKQLYSVLILFYEPASLAAEMGVLDTYFISELFESVRKIELTGTWGGGCSSPAENDSGWSWSTQS